MDHDEPDPKLTETKGAFSPLPSPAQLQQTSEHVRSLKNVLKVLLEGRKELCLNMQTTSCLISKHNSASHCYFINPISSVFATLQRRSLRTYAG